ncbi:MAG: rhodanese-like domain-containing protein [Prolixibacteraceae bacterium]|nr:rhodanese-like domain-containing protein [Prolixibacteraceae bacterium]
MKRTLRLSALLAMLIFVSFLHSCKEDPPPTPDNAYSTLKAYMIANNLDLPAMLSTWVVDPFSTTGTPAGVVEEATSTVPGYTVYDLRSAADFATNHIKNAKNVVLKDIITTVEAAGLAKDAKILIVCYTGQTAGQAVMALRLLGWKNAQVLKWGMAGWNATYQGPWVSNSGFVTPANGDLAVGHANWVTTAAPATGSFAEPTWTSTSTDGAAILKERVQAVLNAGFSTADGSAVLTTPANYTIVNYWSAADYAALGHYAGAFNIPVISLANDLNKGFDPSKETLIYCWTGQTSSMASFWMNVLGYKTKGIGFGANRMIYSNLKTAGKTIYKGPKAWTVTNQ